MGAAFTKKNKIFKRIDLNKLITIFVILVLILTSFTSISTADNINQNITQENPEPIREENDLNEEIEENTLYNSLPDPPKIGDLIKLFRELINFTKAYIEFRKEHPRYIINVSTNLNGYKKSTKLNFFRPTPVDVDDDGDKDIRIWIFRRPAIDFSSLSIALKTTYLIRRLPGLNDNITDFFEITLEYETSPLHYLFFVTKDIEKIRIGYQSPKGEEIPQNCLLIDKMIPHFRNPWKKTGHKISVDPGSIKAKDQLNLIFSLDILNAYLGEAELTMQMNFTPAIKVKDITFERKKPKLFSNKQILEIYREKTIPDNVSLILSVVEFGEFGRFIVENIPTHLTLSWSIGFDGYLTINTHDSKFGKIKALINNYIFFAFSPQSNTNLKISWENRTWIRDFFSGSTYNVSIELYNPLVLEDFYFSRLMYNDEQVLIEKLELSIKKIDLNFEGIVDFSNVSGIFYFLFDTLILWYANNIEIKGVNVSAEIEDINVYYQVFENSTNKQSNLVLNDNQSLNLNHPKNENIGTEPLSNHQELKIDYLYFSLGNFSFSLYNKTSFFIDYSGELDASLIINNFYYENIFPESANNTILSFSKVHASAYGKGKVFSSIEKEENEININVTGNFSLEDLYIKGMNNGSIDIKSIKAIGEISFYGIHDPIDEIYKYQSTGFHGSIEMNEFQWIDSNQNSTYIGYCILSGTITYYDLPVPEETDFYIGKYIKINDGLFEIKDVESTNPILDCLDRVYVNGSGDLKFEINVNENNGDIQYIIRSVNGISLNKLLLKLDNGVFFRIEREATASIEISPGYFQAVYNINGDGDGMIFVDSTYLTIQNAKITYDRSMVSDWGIEITFPDRYFDADGWCLQWDSFYSELLGVLIIYNWEVSGEINPGKIRIKIRDRIKWYSLWPI